MFLYKNFVLVHTLRSFCLSYLCTVWIESGKTNSVIIDLLRCYSKGWLSLLYLHFMNWSLHDRHNFSCTQITMSHPVCQFPLNSTFSVCPFWDKPSNTQTYSFRTFLHFWHIEICCSSSFRFLAWTFVCPYCVPFQHQVRRLIGIYTGHLFTIAFRCFYWVK